ncbi:cyclic nucleotide-gated ion channel 1-like [Mangifera indica]|uniref:cyclic nucleotide-gated ion channel 1-like n=1 Tax=Mangifera indica TaxID=29780 RepID=UPI001CFA6E1C|nr:cyclic nucleotide-gated ion channel 1-like [Mangifera indica]
MQTYLQSETIRSGEVRLQGRKTEQWMSFWKLSEKLQQEVKKFQPYLNNDPEAKIVHAENLLKKLPRDLQKNIKCELCLELLKTVEEFGSLSESALEDLCGCLKPVSFNERARIVEEGDPVDEMLFIVQGKLRTYTSMDVRTGSAGNNCRTILLKDGDICGKGLVTWVLADPYSTTLPVSTTTILAVTKVEAFAITVEDLQDVFAKLRAVHFIQLFWRFKRALHSRKGHR